MPLNTCPLHDGRASAWIDDLAGIAADQGGGSPWTHQCAEGNCLTGYTAVAGFHVGGIEFKEGPIPRIAVVSSGLQVAAVSRPSWVPDHLLPQRPDSPMTAVSTDIKEVKGAAVTAAAVAAAKLALAEQCSTAAEDALGSTTKEALKQATVACSEAAAAAADIAVAALDTAGRISRCWEHVAVEGCTAGTAEVPHSSPGKVAVRAAAARLLVDAAEATEQAAGAADKAVRLVQDVLVRHAETAAFLLQLAKASAREASNAAIPAVAEMRGAVKCIADGRNAAHAAWQQLEDSAAAQSVEAQQAEEERRQRQRRWRWRPRRAEHERLWRQWQAEEESSRLPAGAAVAAARSRGGAAVAAGTSREEAAAGSSSSSNQQEHHQAGHLMVACSILWLPVPSQWKRALLRPWFGEQHAGTTKGTCEPAPESAAAGSALGAAGPATAAATAGGAPGPATAAAEAGGSAAGSATAAAAGSSGGPSGPAMDAGTAGPSSEAAAPSPRKDPRLFDDAVKAMHSAARAVEELRQRTAELRYMCATGHELADWLRSGPVDFVSVSGPELQKLPAEEQEVVIATFQALDYWQVATVDDQLFLASPKGQAQMDKKLQAQHCQLFGYAASLEGISAKQQHHHKQQWPQRRRSGAQQQNGQHNRQQQQQQQQLPVGGGRVWQEQHARHRPQVIRWGQQQQVQVPQAVLAPLDRAAWP